MRVSPGRRDNRYATRMDVTVPARLREIGSTERFDVLIEDMSLTGFCCSTSFDLNVGQAVAITMPGLASLEARVAWAQHYRYGCEFNRALHVAVLDHIVRQHRKA